MSISNTVKKIMPYLRGASEYILLRLSSQAVEMDDGTTLEQKVTSLNSLIASKVDTSSVMNNVLTTEEGFVLDARQGKELDNKITELNSNLYEDLTEYFTVNWAWDVDRLEAARTGRLVHISFMCHPKDSWSANQIYTVITSTLPDEYKPEYRTYSSGVKMNGDGTDVNNCAFIVQPTGDINIAVGAKVTSGYFLCNMTYVCVGSS